MQLCSGEAEEEEQQQMELRGLQPEAIGLQSLRPGIHGQGASQVRPGLQHVPQVLRRRRISPCRNPKSAASRHGTRRRRAQPQKEAERLVRVPPPGTTTRS